MTSRILRAILIGPAVVPAAVFIFAIASGIRLRESVALAAIYGAFSYGRRPPRSFGSGREKFQSQLRLNRSGKPGSLA
jgi:hypothetical protein